MSERKTMGDGTVKSSQFKQYLDGYQVDGTGTASIVKGSKQAVLTDNGTGDYTLTFNQPYKRAGIAVACAIGATAAIVQIASISTTAVNVLCFDATGAAVDADFMLHLIGFEYESEY
jgi:hypothetical protein